MKNKRNFKRQGGLINGPLTAQPARQQRQETYTGTFYVGQQEPGYLVDNLKVASIALPNAANTVCTAAIDLEAGQPFPTTGEFAVQVTTTSGTGNANSNNINIAIQQANAYANGVVNTSNFANIPGLSTYTVLSVNGNYPAQNIVVQLPPGVSRFIRATALGETGGGNSATGTLTVQLLF